MEALYDDFIKQVNLRDIHLTAVQYRKLGNPTPEQYPDIEISYRPRAIKYCQNDDCLEVTQDIAFTISECGETEEKHKLFDLKATYVLIYHSPLQVDDKLFDLFKTRNIPVNLHPFARELIQNATTRVGLPAYTLPVLRIKK